MSWAGLDQRVFPRFSARCDIAISGGGQTIKTQTQNIGIGGLRVILNQELEKLSQVRLRFVLDESQSVIECNVRVVWMIPSKELSSSKVRYDTGFEFVNLDPLDRDRIQSFIQRLHK